MTAVRTKWALLAGLTLLCASPATSAPKQKDGPPPAQVTSVLSCRAIADGAERLACYDRSTAALDQAVAKRELVVFDRESVRKTKRGLFGFSIPNLGIFGDEDGEVDIKQVDGVISGTGRNADGGYIFRLADGSRWSQTDGKMIVLGPRSGDKVVVKKAALGSYIMSVAGQPGVKVKRIN